MAGNVTVYEKFTEQQRIWLGAACLRMVKLLEDLAKRATDANKAREAARYTQEAERVKTDLLARIMQQPLHATADERRALEAGLRVLAHNYRAAAGTVLALGESKLCEQFKEKATQIEEELLPEFAEQIDMKLAEKGRD